MKKFAGLFVTLAFFTQFAGPAFAAERGSEEYKKLVELKKAQREKKATAKAQGVPQEPNFWQKEASRSGLAGTAAMFGNAVSSAVPLDKPNSRKTD